MSREEAQKAQKNRNCAGIAELGLAQPILSSQEY